MIVRWRFFDFTPALYQTPWDPAPRALARTAHILSRDKICGGNKRAHLAKPRAAGCVVLFYIIPMHPRLAVLLHAQRIPLKAEWRRRLRIEPASTPLANPDTLVYLMDETLTQLEALVRNRPAPRWLRLRKTHLGPLRSALSLRAKPAVGLLQHGRQRRWTRYYPLMGI